MKLPIAFLISVLTVFLMIRSQTSAPLVHWAGQGHCRLLAEVDPIDLGGRDRDEMPAEVVIDLLSKLKEAGISNNKANVASFQIIRYDPVTGRPYRYKDYAYGRSPFDRPFRWYDLAIPYDFPEFSANIDSTEGVIRRQNWLRGGYFYNSIGDWNAGHLAWIHTQEGNQPSYYAIYFDLLKPGQRQEVPPRGWLGDGMQRCDELSESSTGADHTRLELDDWNDDGLVDIVFGENYGHLFFFPNMGTKTQPEFPFYKMIFGADGLPIDTGSILSPLVVDWNGDGVKDLIAGTEWNRVVFFENQGTNRDRKLVYKGFLKADGRTLTLPTRPMERGSPDVFKRDYYPVLTAVDWDGDGDLDLLAGGYITGRIYLYENVGREPDGLPILKFKGPLEADGKPLNVKHWCAAPCVADFDSDGDLDLITGTLPITEGGGDSIDSEHFLRYYENVGTRTRPILKERPFPKAGTFPRASLATPRAVDWDNDGLLDLIVSARDKIYLFKNIGTKTQPKFLVHDRPLHSRWGGAPLPGTGAETSTQFIDWDRDGALDIVANFKIWRNLRRGNPGVYSPDPIPVLPHNENISHASGIGDDWFWPRLYDLDQDGKIDVLFGDWSGRIWFHRNLSSSTKTHFDTVGYTLKLTNGEEIKVGPTGDPTKDFDVLQGARTVFTVADFDNDGLNDLVTGDTYGKIRYYKNSGTREKPVFSPPVEVGDQKIRLMVDATDWNGDGRMDIIAGAANGIVRVYLNTGSKGEAKFARGFDPGLPPIVQPRVIMADLNGDGDEDLFLPSIQGSVFIERSFLQHGYARGRILKIEKKGRQEK